MNKVFLSAIFPLMMPVIFLMSCGKPSSQETEVTSTPTEINSSKNTEALPTHTVSDSPLGNGKRIQVDSNDPQLSRDDCLRLAQKYASTAGQGGQVVVQKINPKPPWNGELLPFCVDNRDGEGVSYNDFYFK